ncbi:hypothetical protein BDF14DRAFT_1777839 [Spinellus fusiger]|nr:hypothetical protein BDF14DRAFT_1777839 [Spinellus fusiger]
MNTPIDTNAWSGPTSGPRYGNAYEDNTSTSLVTEQHSTQTDSHPQRMPSPGDYRPPIVWNESNKTESGPDTVHHQETVHTSYETSNAYQYAGTRLGNQDPTPYNAYAPTHTPTPQVAETAAAETAATTAAATEAALPPKWEEKRKPSKARLLLRFLQFLGAVGSLGFAAGASPFAGISPPLASVACFYFLFAVAIVSFLWAGFHLGHYVYRRLAHGAKMNRPAMTGLDTLLAILWGVGVIVEVTKYPCPPGGFNHWCDFYNVSIFWGFLSFALFIAAAVWDVVGACLSRK